MGAGWCDPKPVEGAQARMLELGPAVGLRAAFGPLPLATTTQAAFGAVIAPGCLLQERAAAQGPGPGRLRRRTPTTILARTQITHARQSQRSHRTGLPEGCLTATASP